MMNDEQFTAKLQEYASSRDTALRDELFEAYLPLTRTVARRFSARGIDVEDLEQVAGMALLKALERYDPAMGYRFVSFAVPTLTGAVRNYIRDKSSLLRVPRDYQRRLSQMAHEQTRFEAEHLRTPSAAELAAQMGLSPDELLSLLSMREQYDTVSLDAAIGDEGDDSLSALLGQPDEHFEQLEQSDWMKWILSKVNNQERELLLLRYRDGLGQREVAKRIGVSQMQISRLERRVLERLRVMEASGSR